MKEIPLTRGQVALVDDRDYPNLVQWKWCARWSVHLRCFYAGRGIRRNGQHREIKMHRQICGLDFGDKRQVDHIDHNTLNNCRSNLRVCTHAENLRNMAKHKKNTSGHKGVSWSKDKECWRAEIRANNKHIFIGWFQILEDACEAYRETAKRIHGEFVFKEVA